MDNPKTSQCSTYWVQKEGQLAAWGNYYIQCSPEGMENTMTSLICARLGKLGPTKGRASLLGELPQLGSLLKLYSVVAYFVFDLVWFSFLLHYTHTHAGVHTQT